MMFNIFGKQPVFPISIPLATPWPFGPFNCTDFAACLLLRSSLSQKIAVDAPQDVVDCQRLTTSNEIGLGGNKL